MHILVPLKGVEFGHFYDDQPIEGSNEDQLRNIGHQLLGQALSPNFGWETEEGSAFITKPTPALPSQYGWHRSRQLYEHREEIDFASRMQQKLGEDVVARFVDLESAIKRERYAILLASIRGRTFIVDYPTPTRPILLPGDELAQK